MPTFIFEPLIILLLLLLNGLFAMSEIAVVSARKARLQQRAEQGDSSAMAALELANSPSRFLSTVQIGITLVGIFAGAFGGATIAGNVATVLSTMPALAPYSEPISVALVVVVITFLSVVIGELVPKQIALSNPERIAALIAKPMRALSKIAAPIVHLFSGTSELVLRLLGIRPSSEPAITEEEIKILLKQGTVAGVFDPTEQQLVERIFRLGDRKASTLMTPRTEMVWLDVDDSITVNQQKIIDSGHSRFPVGQGSIDNILGVVRAKDVLARLVAGEALDLRQVVRPALFLPETTHAFTVLEQFKRTRPHMALLIDEYGGLQGVVTLNDILGAIVGEMPSADETGDVAILQRTDGSWLIDGMLPIQEFMDKLEIRELPGYAESEFETVAGFVLHQLGRFPKPSDSFEWKDWRVEVVDMDARRIDKVLLTPLRGNRSDHKTTTGNQERR